MKQIKHTQSFSMLAVLALAGYLKMVHGIQNSFLDGAANLLIVFILLAFGEMLLLSILAWSFHGISWLIRQTPDSALTINADRTANE